jgi:hypothetical protein
MESALVIDEVVMRDFGKKCQCMIIKLSCGLRMTLKSEAKLKVGATTMLMAP